MISKLIWNYEDVDTDILKIIDTDHKLMGYFKLDTEIFTFTQRKLPLSQLKQIANEYDEALRTAKLIAKK